MRTNVYAWDANPAVDRRLYPLSINRAKQEVADGLSKFIVLANGYTAIQRLPPNQLPDYAREESIGRSNLVPFGRVPNPMLAPQKLHYEVPHAGDRTCYSRHRRSKIRVTSTRTRVARQMRMRLNSAIAS